MATKSVPSFWGEVAKVAIPAVLAASVAVLGTVWGANLSFENKDREMDIRLVEIALSILKGEASDNSKPARTYAIELLKRYPETIALPDATWTAWINGGDVPFESVVPWSAANWKYGAPTNYICPEAMSEEQCLQATLDQWLKDWSPPRTTTTPSQ